MEKVTLKAAQADFSRGDAHVEGFHTSFEKRLVAREVGVVAFVVDRHSKLDRRVISTVGEHGFAMKREERDGDESGDEQRLPQNGCTRFGCKLMRH